MDSLAENLTIIQENIKRAAEKSGRHAADVTLIGVTKTIGAERIQRLVDLGVAHLGENKVQELCDKFPIIVGDPVWHMIGHLQTNKVKYIIDKVAMIHSVDSLKLGEEIQKRAQRAGKVMDVLIEVNIAEEDTKNGIKADKAYELAEKLKFFDHIAVKGLMTIAPYVENPEENRIFFRKMKQLFVDIQEKLDHNRNMTFLSMGMTNDYEVAIEEGANIVRVGTGLFGRRIYQE